MSLMIFMFAFLFFAAFMTFANGPAAAVATCKIKKGKDTLIINVADFPVWGKKGWKRVGAAPLTPVADEAAGRDDAFDLLEAAEIHDDLDAIIDDFDLDVDKDLKKEDKVVAISEALE